MKLEDIATPPPRPSPQVRYASLNRTIESGLATDQTWSELTRVCLELGRDEEACKAFERVRDAATRRRLLVYLHRRGLMRHVDQSKPTGGHATQTPNSRLVGGDDKVADLIADSLRYLFIDHMPLAVIVATVIFPIVVGVGGALSSAAGSTLFLPLIALIPALSILALVGAMGRRILLESAKGLDDPPEIPTAQELGHEALRFLLDGTVLGLVFLGPGFLVGLLGVGVAPAVATVLVGGLLAPMAMAMRQSHDDWRCLNPNVLFRTVARGGTLYLGCALFSILLFAPALISVWVTRDSHVYLIVSVVGPLAVAPLFMVSRMMGLVLSRQQRDQRQTDSSPALQRQKQAVPPSRSTGTTFGKQASRTPLRGASAHPETSAKPRRTAWSGAALGTPRMKTRPAAPAVPVAQHSAGGSFFNQTASSAPVPDLAHMPGARVLRGDARRAAGAAAEIRPH